MKKFDVEITETLQRTVSVEAASQEEAERMVTESWNNDDYVLDSKDFIWIRRVDNVKKREHRLFIRVTDEERNRILDKMYGMGIRSLSAYIRKMALDGYCLNLDLPQLRRMAYLLQNCSSNLNQVAKRANESGNVYSADLADLRIRLDELISIGKQILAKLADL